MLFNIFIRGWKMIKLFSSKFDAKFSYREGWEWNFLIIFYKFVLYNNIVITSVKFLYWFYISSGNKCMEFLNSIAWANLTPSMAFLQKQITFHEALNHFCLFFQVLSYNGFIISWKQVLFITLLMLNLQA